LQEEHHRVALEANKAIRDAQKLDRFIRMASESYINSKLAYEKMRLALDAATPKEDSSNWEKLIKMLNKEIANLKSNLSRKLDEAASKGSKVEALQEKINELYENQVATGKELQDLVIRHFQMACMPYEQTLHKCILHIILNSLLQRTILSLFAPFVHYIS